MGSGRFFYARTLKRPRPVFELIRPRHRQQLPVVPSPQEVRSLLALVQRSKARMCLQMIYACGLLLREGTQLQVSDIDTQRMLVRVRQGKGGKDRVVPLAERTLELMRVYWQPARPGGNLTGLTGLATELSGKRLELLREAIPSLACVAVLWNARDAAMTHTFRGIQAAAPVLGVAVQPLGVREAKEIDSAIAAMTAERPDALFMISDVLTSRHMKQVVDFAARHQLPTLFEGKGPVAQGGLISYGPSVTDLLRRAASYVDKILKGAKPADLPVEQPMKFELVITLTIPPSLLLLADEVIR